MVILAVNAINARQAISKFLNLMSVSYSQYLLAISLIIMHIHPGI